jgi:hypothetical protein
VPSCRSYSGGMISMEFSAADLSPAPRRSCASESERSIRAEARGPAYMGVVNYRRWASSKRIRHIGRGRAFGDKSLQGGLFGVSPSAMSAEPSSAEIPRSPDCELLSDHRLPDAQVVALRFETNRCIIKQRTPSFWNDSTACGPSDPHPLGRDRGRRSHKSASHHIGSRSISRLLQNVT